MAEAEIERCRLVLVTPPDIEPNALADRLVQAGRGGDIASVIVPAYDLDEDRYQDLLAAIVPAGQAIGAAVMAAGTARIAARAGADGVHLRGGTSEIVAAIAASQGQWLVGADAGNSRHAALEIGEARPDYVFFGRLGADTHAEPHSKVLELAAWWAQLVEIPAIVMGGRDLAHLETAAATGAEFVALSRAVLGDGVDAAQAVEAANAVLARFVLEDAA